MEDEADLAWVACDVCMSWMHQDCVSSLKKTYMVNSITKGIRFECEECWYDGGGFTSQKVH